MEFIFGFRRFFLSVWLLTFTGSANAQGGTGIPMGHGLANEMMGGSAFGELPNPLLPLPSSGGQQSIGLGNQATGVDSVSHTGGGLDAHGFPMLGPDFSSLFPIDPSSIIGVANGQTIYLPGFLSNQLHSGSRDLLPVESPSSQPVDTTNEQYVLRNEDFTALGNVGHLVRVPMPDSPPPPGTVLSSHSVANSSSSTSESNTFTSIASDGTVAVDPKDIIGVADMNVLGPDGNPQFFSFNPGTGHASEISALQSALTGTAVDMTDMVPPPFESVASVDVPPPPMDINSKRIPNTPSDINTYDAIPMDNIALTSDTSLNKQSTSAMDAQGITNFQTGTNTLGLNSMTTGNGALTSINRNDLQALNNINTESNMFGTNSMVTGESSLTNINEQSMFNTGGLSMQGVMDQAAPATGNLNVNEQLMLGPSNQNLMIQDSASSSNTMNTLEQSMFGTLVNPEQAMLNSGSTSNNNALNTEQEMLNAGAADKKTSDRFSANNDITSLNATTVNDLPGQSLGSRSSANLMSSIADISQAIKESSVSSNLSDMKMDPNIITKEAISNSVLSKPQNDANVFNVDTKVGVNSGQSNNARTSMGRLFGMTGTHRDNSNRGLSGSRFGRINAPANIEPLKVGTKIDLTQLFATATSNAMGAGQRNPGQNIPNPVASSNSFSAMSDSSNTFSTQTTENQVSASSTDAGITNDVPHVSDLNTEGVYPFEGSLSARDATLSEGSSVILDMNSVLQGKEPLHLEPPVIVPGDSSMNSGSMSQTNTAVGIDTRETFQDNSAVLQNNNALLSTYSAPSGTDITVDITNQGAETVTSTDTLSLTITGSNDMQPLGNEFNLTGIGQSVLNSDQNTLAIDKVNEYVGIDNTNVKDQSRAGGNKIAIGLLDTVLANKNNVISSNENTLLSQLTKEVNEFTKAGTGLSSPPESSLTSLTDFTQEQLVAGNNNKDINTINTYETIGSEANTKLTSSTNEANVAFTGFSGAPITNMLGVIPGQSSGGVVVSGLSVPSFKTTSSSSLNDFEASPLDNSQFPSNSFVIGAGQPNSKIISAGRVDHASLAANVGGVAIGSNPNQGLPNLSLPSSAFKSKEKLHDGNQLENKQNNFKTVKVDMSNFIPPPYENPSSSQTSNTLGSTEDLIQKAINRHSRTNANSIDIVSDSRTDSTSISTQKENNMFASSNNVMKSDVPFQSNQATRGSMGLLDVSSQHLLQEQTDAININNDLTNQISRSDRFNNRPGPTAKAPATSERSNNLSGGTTLIQDTSRAGQVKVTGGTTTEHKTINDQGASMVTSNEHFGKVAAVSLSPHMFIDNTATGQQSSVNLGMEHYDAAVPSVVVDHAIFTDTAQTPNVKLSPSASRVAAALDIHANSKPLLVSSSGERSFSSPIVGSLFGTSSNSRNILTKRFLEKSGITREPAVDFMSNFLQHSKSTRSQPGNKQLHIVPLSNFSPKSQNIVTGSQSDAKTVDQFGVADIYTRKQQLNPNQWKQLMSSVSQDQTARQSNIGIDYTTKNLIGTGETKPLVGNINTGASMRLTASSPSRSSRFTTGGQNDVRSFVLFAAPGIKDAAGPQSVTIQNYKPRAVNIGSRFSTFPSTRSSAKDVGQQNLREFVGQQATAERTSSFANTFKSNNQVGSNIHLSNQGTGMSINAVDSPLKNRISVEPQLQKQDQLGESGQKIQNEMNTFKLGRSILISDGVIPEFTGPNSVQRLPFDARDLQGLSTNGMRLGQPAIASTSGSQTGQRNTMSGSSQSMFESEMTSTNDATLQGIQRTPNPALQTAKNIPEYLNQNIGLSIDAGLTSAANSGLVQSRQNSGMVDRSGFLTASQGNAGLVENFRGLSESQKSFGINSGTTRPKPNRNVGIAILPGLNPGFNAANEMTQSAAVTNTGSQQAMQSVGNMVASGLDQKLTDAAAITGLNEALKKQPMEQTLFTSGSRFAVFGRAGDVNGQSVGNGHLAKAIPARRMGVLGPVHDCRYKPDPSSEYYFIYKNGITQHRFRCALGTAFDEMTCECSIRISDHGDCLEVHMDFNNGVVEDSSLNRLPIGNENVEITNSSSRIPGLALFGGDSKLTIWRYQNYDFRDHVMLKVQFRPGVGGDRLQPLVTNCDSSATDPSLGVVYDSVMQEVVLMLKTVNDTLKELRFKINPDEWNDVTYIYDGQEFIGIVNGVRRYVSRENPHLLGIIGGEIKSAPSHGLVEIRDAAIVLGHCPMYGHFRGAMVDIQIYTCIPKDFRLE